MGNIKTGFKAKMRQAGDEALGLHKAGGYKWYPDMLSIYGPSECYTSKKGTLEKNLPTGIQGTRKNLVCLGLGSV